MVKALISVEPHVINTMSRFTKHKNVCFELFGFDILLDSKLKPWLLEVNISPSLSSSSPLDKKIKTVLICDTVNLIGVQPYDRKSYEKEAEIREKKRLLGASAMQDHQQDANMLDLIREDPSSFLAKLVKQMGGDMSEDEVQMVVDFEEE